MSKALKAVFMGTPDFAAIILDKIIQSEAIEISAVYTQPDRPAGRGKKLREPAVKILAKKHNIPVYQPLNFSQDEDVEELAALKPDLLLVAAYGLILPQKVLDIPSLMPLNVHASLLPKYRGAAPIQRSIMAGDRVTGVTIMRMEKGLDTGPILLQEAMGIDINDTFQDLHDELAKSGADLLLKLIHRIKPGHFREIKQDGLVSSYAAMLSKKDGDIDFSKSPEEIHAHIRGVSPWPGGRCKLFRDKEESLYISLEPGLYPLPQDEDTKEKLEEFKDLKPGQIAGIFNDALYLRTGKSQDSNDDASWYAFKNLKPAGRASMDARSFFNGYLSQFSHYYFG